ncbi:ABC transporter ATP-binding protein [Dysgonomonas sp. OttesenSCG-928-M03]|nr:ABC transporter ATP-binding protein [Dysgonomonas sp. OttesenSCG-928-M03]
MISIQNLSASYGKTAVLRNFSMSLDKGQSYALIGPSGCGKSTLLKILCGIHKQFSGTVFYEGKPYFDEKIAIGYVPQTYGLLDWKTIKENIYLPLTLNKAKTLNQKEAMEIIDILEIEDLLDRYPLQLSGGQRQRVALARAFIYQPDLLLMDEPFSSLDSFTSARSQHLYLELWKKYNITTLFITHNIYEAASISKHILLMSKQSGNIIDQIENHTFGSGDRIAQMQLANHITTLFEQAVV